MKLRKAQGAVIASMDWFGVEIVNTGEKSLDQLITRVNGDLCESVVYLWLLHVQSIKVTQGRMISIGALRIHLTKKISGRKGGEL